MPRKKRRSAWASISEPERGVFRIRYWGTDAKGVYRRMSETVRGSRKEAERRRSELMLLHSEDAPCPTVGEVWRMHVLPDMERRVEDGDLSIRTIAAYRRSWTADVEPTWGDVPCSSVRPLAIQQWLMGLGLSQARRALQILTCILDYAVRYELIEHNTAREKYLMPSKSTVVERDKGVWSLSELNDVWDAVRDGAPWMEAAFILAAFGGCRVSESLGPLASEVKLREVDGIPVAIVPIVRQVTKETGVSDRLKTKSSRRYVVIPGEAALALRDIADRTPADWPLTNDGNGAFQNRDRANRSWRKNVLPLLPKEQQHIFQNLRNSWQTYMRWTIGLAPFYIEVLMGHVTAGITGKHYDRPNVDQLVEVVVAAWRTHLDKNCVSHV